MLTQKFMLRLPLQVKAWIADQAHLNGSSQNSEIIRAIRERMERTNQPEETQK